MVPDDFYVAPSLEHVASPYFSYVQIMSSQDSPPNAPPNVWARDASWPDGCFSYVGSMASPFFLCGLMALTPIFSW